MASETHHTICKHCKKQNEIAFVRCLRCGRFRSDIAKAIFFSRLFLPLGCLALFGAAYFACTIDDADSVSYPNKPIIISTASVALSFLAFIMGFYFIKIAKRKTTQSTQ